MLTDLTMIDHRVIYTSWNSLSVICASALDGEINLSLLVCTIKVHVHSLLSDERLRAFWACVSLWLVESMCARSCWCTFVWVELLYKSIPPIFAHFQLMRLCPEWIGSQQFKPNQNCWADTVVNTSLLVKLQRNESNSKFGSNGLGKLLVSSELVAAISNVSWLSVVYVE